MVPQYRVRPDTRDNVTPFVRVVGWTTTGHGGTGDCTSCETNELAYRDVLLAGYPNRPEPHNRRERRGARHK